MARFSDDSIERVREAADIVEVISAHSDLRRQGARWVGLCPFHEERTPSFSVDAAEKLYHCFGCGVGGDVFKFVIEKENLDFPQAVEMLADRFGVELERSEEDPKAEAARKRRARLGELLERTAVFYVNFLWESPKAAKARDYLARRGLGEEVLRAFGIGYAPSAWDQVLTRGQRAGFSTDDMGVAGLVQKNRRGGVYDRFRARIMFPVRDARGRVQGFGARELEPAQGQPKYLNSPDGDLFHKGRLLFGFDRARGAIAKEGRAVVVEGYTDVLALHQAGIEAVVGVMGTAITSEQVALLSGQVDEVVLALDADSAGQEAMLRAQRVAAGRRMRMVVAAMPPGEDPAEMLTAKGGAERFMELVERGEDLASFHVGLVLAAADTGTATGRDRALADVAPVLAQMEEGAARDEQVRRVAERIDLEPSLVIGRLTEAAARPVSPTAGPERIGQRGSDPGGQAPATLSPRERRERALLAMCIATPKEGVEYLDRLTPEHLTEVGLRAVEWLRGHLEEPLSGLPRSDEPLAEFVTQLVMLAKQEPASPDAMELNFLQLEQRRIEALIAAAGDEGAYERRAELSLARAAVTERIARTERGAG